MPETYWRDAYDTLKKRVSELEQKPCMQITRIFSEEEINKIINEDMCNQFQKILSERIEKLEKQNQSQQFPFNQMKKLEKEIAELKEQVNGHIDHFHNDMHYLYHKKCEEVLRESFDLAEELIIGRIPDKEDFKRYIKRLGELRKKLSGEKSEDDLTPGTARASSTDSKTESILVERKKFRKCILKAWNNGFDYERLILDKFDKENTLKEIEKYLEGT